ncbi:MAG: response regulator transcription factor [Chitinophagales bacterium]|nr:response regulator transcription factor [Chitinophagales bacterium]MCZ2393033.1 response regulator transcription factor [Chitinophagales bacterium]
MKGKVKVIISDAQFLIRAGILDVVRSLERFECIAECSDSRELREAIRIEIPDVVIIDYAQEGYFSLEDLKFLKDTSPNINILVISSDANSQHVFQALNYGAVSFLTKECGYDEIINALLATEKSEKFICHRIIDVIIHNKLFNTNEADCRPYALSLRELEIIQLTAKGLSAKEIAQQLFLSLHTVYTHKKNIMKKLNLNSSSEMILYAINNGIAN